MNHMTVFPFFHQVDLEVRISAFTDDFNAERTVDAPLESYSG